MENKVVLVGFLAILVTSAMAMPISAEDVLVGRAVLPANTTASGPTSGQFIGEGPINGVFPHSLENSQFRDFQPL